MKSMKCVGFPILLCLYRVLAQEASVPLNLTSLLNNRAFAIGVGDANFTGNSGKLGCSTKTRGGIDRVV